MSQTRVEYHPELAQYAVDLGAAEGNREAMEHLRDAAYSHVPRDTGHLAETATVSQEGTLAVLSYDTAYAQALHAHPEWHFQDGREAHWLEAATAEVQGDLAAIVGAAITRHL